VLASDRFRQRRAAVLTLVLAALFDLLFLAVNELPATVPVALALIVVEVGDRIRLRAALRGNRIRLGAGLRSAPGFQETAPLGPRLPPPGIQPGEGDSPRASSAP
jgi:hypothetical protein